MRFQAESHFILNFECDQLVVGVVCSVPMWKKNMRERGFNQAEILARGLGERLEIVYCDVLLRTRETEAMYGLNKKERKENIKGAFEVNIKNLDKIGGKNVILIDDVWTTGSTMKECCKVLHRCGVNKVWGITLAR